MIIEKIFFDANIILDMIDIDRGNIQKARTLVSTALVNDIELYTSCDILSNVYYVAHKKLGKEIVVDEMLRLLELFDIVPIEKSLAKNALLANRSDLSLDFEDLLQSHCAETIECDLIVTNDKRFAKGKVKHLSMNEALDILKA